MIENDTFGILGPGHVRLLRLSEANGKSKVVGSYSPRVLKDLNEPLYLGDDSGVFGITALAGNPSHGSYNGTPFPSKPTQVAVVRIR